MEKEKMVAVKGDIPDSMRARFKSMCAVRNITMSDVLASLVEKWIEEEGEETIPFENVNGTDFLKSIFQESAEVPDPDYIDKLSKETGIDYYHLLWLASIVVETNKYKMNKMRIDDLRIVKFCGHGTEIRPK